MVFERLEILEKQRQEESINLIASENYSSFRVKQALSSIFGDKYAEGSPGKRFYAGCGVVDELEEYTSNLACKLFKAEYANVQPHSGSNANLVAYASQLEIGDKILAMSMKAGGHLTHGGISNLSSKFYNFIHYGLESKTQFIDYNQIEELAKKHNPKMILAGASAYPREIDFELISKICQKYNAIFMVDMAHIAGLVVAKLHQNPFDYADIVTTTTQKTLRGPRGGIIFSRRELSKSIQKAVMPGVQGGPHMNSILAKAVALQEAMSPDFCQYQRAVVENAKAMAKVFLDNGKVLISGGTDNHLIIIDVFENGCSKNSISGKQAEQLLESIGIVTNRNFITDDQLGPLVTSGLRLGTAAMTTRHMGLDEAEKIAKLIIIAIENRHQQAVLDELSCQIKLIAKALPIN